MGFASCKSVRREPESDFSSSDVRTKIESEPPIPCVDAKKITGLVGWLGPCQRASATTPTISIHGDLLFVRINRPSGDSPGNEARASVSLITATGGRSSVSVRSKSRPARIGISRVLKKSDVIAWISAFGRSPG